MVKDDIPAGTVNVPEEVNIAESNVEAIVILAELFCQIAFPQLPAMLVIDTMQVPVFGKVFVVNEPTPFVNTTDAVPPEAVFGELTV
jgi:hypothetical protein